MKVILRYARPLRQPIVCVLLAQKMGIVILPPEYDTANSTVLQLKWLIDQSAGLSRPESLLASNQSKPDLHLPAGIPVRWAQ